MTQATEIRPPKETVTITLTITETPDGSVTINKIEPDEAVGTVAGILAQAGFAGMNRMLADVLGQAPTVRRSIVQ